MYPLRIWAEGGNVTASRR